MTRSSAVRSTVTSRSDAVRSSTIAYRIPEVFSTFGVTSLYDWREGYAGIGQTSVADPIGGKDISFRGSTAISSVLSAGRYSADLEFGATDYFKTNDVFRHNSGGAISRLTIFVWVKKESNGVAYGLIARWRPSGTGRSWRLRTTSGNLIQYIASINGTSTGLQVATASAITDNTNYHLIVVVNNNPGNFNIYIDGVNQTVNYTTGSGPINHQDSQIETWIGAEADASNNPTVPCDGLIGMCGYCVGTAWTAQQVTDFYNMTKSLGGY